MSSSSPSFIPTTVLPLNKALNDQQLLQCATDKTVFVLGRFQVQMFESVEPIASERVFVCAQPTLNE